MRRRDGHPPKQVNPLKRRHGGKLASLPARWFELSYGSRVHRGLVVDVGCGDGAWVLAAAAAFPELNFLGLDVRDVMPPSSGNAQFLAANTSEGDLDRLLRMAPSVKFVFAQFPDPHWKARHRKRAMITASLCRAVALSGAFFVVKTDCKHVVDDATRAARESPALLTMVDNVDGDLEKLIAIPTERQEYAQARDLYLRVFAPDPAPLKIQLCHARLKVEEWRHEAGE